MREASPTLLLVEDDPQDAFLVGKSLTGLPGGVALQHVRGLIEAKDYLLGREGYENAILPACVMVDLKLTDGTGKSLIEWMLTQVRCEQIPVIVFSGDRSGYPELDTLPNVACQITKPDEVGGYDVLSRALRPIVMSAMASANPQNDNFGARV